MKNIEEWCEWRNEIKKAFIYVDEEDFPDIRERRKIQKRIFKETKNEYDYYDEISEEDYKTVIVFFKNQCLGEG